MQVKTRHLKRKIPISLLKKTSIRIEKNGSKTETTETLSTPKNK